MFPYSLPYNSPLSLIILAVALAGAGTIAALVYRDNPTSATNRIFVFMTLCTVLWMLVTFLVRIPEFVGISLALHRLGIMLAAPMSFLFFLLGHTMPSRTLLLPKTALRISVLATIFMVVLNASPYAFTSVRMVGELSEPVVGVGLLPFSIISTVFSVLAVYFLVRSYRRETGAAQKQFALMLIGIFLLLGLIISTILIPILLFHSIVFLPFTPLYVMTFLGLTAYAITRYQLFNIKVLVAQAFVTAIDIILFAKIFGEESTDAIIIDAVVLVCVLVFGYFLVRSVRNEVSQRERIQEQEKELVQSNARLKELDIQKSEFLSFASHQLRTPLTAIKWNAGAVLDHSYGDLPEHLREPIQSIFDQSSLMAVLVNDYLNVSRIEQGKMQYQFGPTDLSQLLTSVAVGLEPILKEKGLQLQTDIPKERIMVWADPGKLNQVFGNIVDNAIKYTPQGSISISLKKMAEKNIAHIEITDTGIGMDAETQSKIFEKFVRGTNAAEVNNGGSGLGLFIVKNFVAAHKGNIWPESHGVGQGTTFFVELPLLVQK